MVFRRRDRPPLHVRAREFLLPRTGWRRALEYIAHRIRRIPDTPHRIALGFACGVLVSFTPLFGLHFFLAAGLAWGLRANIAASLIGTFVGNPATFPAIAALSLSLGRRILGYGPSGRDFGRITRAFGEAVDGLWAGVKAAFGYGAPEWDKLRVFAVDVLWPYTVGGIGPGLLAAVAAYWVLRPLVAAYQAARRARLAKRGRPREDG
jgi:uncharacterized protein (DUF2062 family)